MEEIIDLIIIMPLYNEGKTIKETITKWICILQDIGINYKIEIYNDGSTDTSPQIINELAKTNSKIILHNNKHKGFSKTLYEGYLTSSKAKYIFHADSDTEISPENFKLFWDNKDKAELIIGERIKRNRSLSRYIASYIAKKLINILFNKQGKIIINDVNIPFRLIKKDILDKIIKTVPNHYLYPNLYICAYCLANNIKVKEFSVKYDKPNRKSYLDNIFKLSIYEIISTIQLFEYKIKKSYIVRTKS